MRSRRWCFFRMPSSRPAARPRRRPVLFTAARIIRFISTCPSNRDLRERFQAPGDFAQAYVIAHEVGHHVQNILGIMSKVQSLQGRSRNESEINQLSVRLELQADCLAGMWANHAHRERNILEQGDVEEGLNAAAQIGDDRMQKRAQGYVVPEGFTHGSAEQRVQWFRRGMESVDLKQCDTFSRRPVS